MDDARVEALRQSIIFHTSSSADAAVVVRDAQRFCAFLNGGSAQAPATYEPDPAAIDYTRTTPPPLPQDLGKADQSPVPPYVTWFSLADPDAKTRLVRTHQEVE